jgi:regulator of protease activity HflC (stomatin/prohibitin superfamily)
MPLSTSTALVFVALAVIALGTWLATRAKKKAAELTEETPEGSTEISVHNAPAIERTHTGRGGTPYSSSYPPVPASPARSDDNTKSRRPLIHRVAGRTAIGSVVLAIVFALNGGIGKVDTKLIGFELNGGKVVAVHKNGWYIVNPLHNMKTLDGAIQIDRYEGATAFSKVQTKNGSYASVNVSVSWQLSTEDAKASKELFTNYKDTDAIKGGLVDRRLGAAVNAKFRTYDTLAIGDQAVDPTSFGVEIANTLQASVGDVIKINDVTIKNVVLDDATSAALAGINKETGRTRTAQQGEQTALALAKNNRIVAESLKNGGFLALLDECLKAINNATEKNSDALPEGFNCNLLTGLSGQQVALLLSSSKN